MEILNNTDEFELLDLFDDVVLFAPYRVDRKTIPDDLYVYECRSGDYDANTPICRQPLFEEIAKNVYVDFVGTIISKTDLLCEEKCRMVTIDDYGFVGDFCTVSEYKNGVCEVEQ